MKKNIKSIMLNFLKKQKAGIHSVVIPEPGWNKTKNAKEIIQWINPEETMALTLYFIEMAPDIPTLKNQDILKSFYDKLITEDKGGLVEVALKENDGLAYVKTIFKIPQSPSGVTYIASLTFPFENCSYVIKIQAGEIGTTGIREAIIGDRLFASGEVRPEGNKIIGWLVNPDIYKGFGMNKSELEKYDLEFPDHHLSLTRKLIARIEKEMVFKPEIKKLPPFKN